MTSRATLRDAVVADPGGTLLALDFDGTLAPIVDDPAQAHVHPAAAEALSRLGGRLGTVAVITGRPVLQALELGGFRGRAGLEDLVICGQYGAERWDAATGAVSSPTRPDAVAALAEALPDWLARHGAPGARIEDKHLAVAVHTRGLGDGVLESIGRPLADLARAHGLTVEPGRQVVELRASGVTKGDALRTLVGERSPRVVVYAGDDLGDVPAFDAVDDLRRGGTTGFTVCSASTEQTALVPRADLVLDGPDAVAAWLVELADAL
ncbi:trehalose-phosphatase [Aeromicrobium marinum DSM 15272]|uniref:Trehalose 6-phosphate phosphatase n=1 Tax=Aeromicrobium marinum DSM 15272 TaxID=585531 RepID=E2SDC8_9ACTN|nr:trehalose-phosphatase [Aeromicrobium marinum]EFQ82505.1 trehalose-phosphatase [Aeromicrobium marinum DSM 15272]